MVQTSVIALVAISIVVHVALLRCGAEPTESSDKRECSVGVQTVFTQKRNLPQKTSVVSAADQLAMCEAELEKRLTLVEKFERETADSNALDEMRIILSSVWGPSDEGYKVECHSRICRVLVDPKSGALPADWQDRLQRDQSVRAHFAGLEFNTVDDPHSGSWLREVMIVLASSEATRSIQTLAKLVSDFVHGDALAICRPSTVDIHGDLMIHCKLDAKLKRISVSITGSLSDGDFGRCLERELVKLSAAATIPEDIVDIDNFNFPLML